eukprot:TRINITY_DN4422_c0_g1_i1.p1 TRINITY_DN4422_c0_g1~~TRINITY_DN4422_c0_g1_i1.p1  ORF type:complete len:558 (-),score=81.92 TRINITY_DN4422_c0_g1_i1:470-2113(-)
MEVTINFIAPSRKSILLSLLRVLRLGRLARGTRIFQPFPQLYQLMMGFAATVNAIVYGSIMIGMVILLWSVVTTSVVSQLIHIDVESDDWCETAFSSVLSTSLFYFQTLVAGDSWGHCIIPLTLKYPYLFSIFGTAMVCIQLGFTNLILAVIVEAAAKTRDDDYVKELLEMQAKEKKEIEHFRTVLHSIDADKSGKIDLNELIDGYDKDDVVQHRLLSLGIGRHDLHTLFFHLNPDPTGDFHYDELIDFLMKAEQQDYRKQFMMMRLHIANMNEHLHQKLAGLSNDLGKVIKQLAKDTSGSKSATARSTPTSSEGIAENDYRSDTSRSRSKRRNQQPSDAEKEGSSSAAAAAKHQQEQQQTCLKQQAVGSASSSSSAHVSLAVYIEAQLGLLDTEIESRLQQTVANTAKSMEALRQSAQSLQQSMREYVSINPVMAGENSCDDALIRRERTGDASWKEESIVGLSFPSEGKHRTQLGTVTNNINDASSDQDECGKSSELKSAETQTHQAQGGSTNTNSANTTSSSHRQQPPPFWFLCGAGAGKQCQL